MHVNRHEFFPGDPITGNHRSATHDKWKQLILQLHMSSRSVLYDMDTRWKWSNLTFEANASSIFAYTSEHVGHLRCTFSCFENIRGHTVIIQWPDFWFNWCLSAWPFAFAYTIAIYPPPVNLICFYFSFTIIFIFISYPVAHDVLW